MTTKNNFAGGGRPFQFIKRRMSLKITTIVVAAGLALFPLPANWVERFYSNGVYPRLQSLLTPLANLLPFALIDLLIVTFALGLPMWWGVRIVKAGRGRRLGALGTLLFHTFVLTALILLSFQALWGFNYLREPLASKLEYDEQRLSAEAIKQLKRLTADRLNRESAEAHNGYWPNEEEWRDRLHASLNTTLTELGNPSGIALAVPKTSFMNFYLGAAGIEGFMNPFGHEIILDRELLPFEKPFLLAHEWAHLAGFADEAEASFVGLLACLRSDTVALRYSGWLALYQHTPWPVSGSPEEIKEALRLDPPPVLAAEVMADLNAIRERERKRTNVKISQMQAQVYDRFLKANRIEAGIRSYGLVVRLMVGTSFEPDWVPVRRTGS